MSAELTFLAQPSQVTDCCNDGTHTAIMIGCWGEMKTISVMNCKKTTAAATVEPGPKLLPIAVPSTKASVSDNNPNLNASEADTNAY
jgi:hypothetical protein